MEVLVSGGKILASGAANGDFVLIRLEGDGDPDPLFGGGDGIVTMDFGSSEGAYGDIAVLSGGKVLAVVPTSSGGESALGLGRFTTSGQPRSSGLRKRCATMR